MTVGGCGWFAEVVHAFDRRVEFESTNREVSLNNGILCQAGR